MPAKTVLIERHAPGRRLLVAEEFAESVTALGLPEPEAAAALFAHSRAGSGRAATAVVSLPGHPGRLHLRAVRHGGWLGELLGGALAGTARPEAELRATAALRVRSAPVPQPVLAAGWRVAGALWSGCVGTLHVEDSRDGIEFLASRPTIAERLSFAEAAAAAIRDFHDAGGRHADLHLGNLLLCGPRAESRVLVIDLDRAVAGVPSDAPRRMRELMRLQRSVEKRGFERALGPRARARFLSTYTRGDRALRRALWSNLPRELRALRRHRLGYRFAR